MNQIRATAQRQRTLADGTKVAPPIELQLGWLAERWGIQVLGEISPLMLGRINRALNVFDAFRLEHQQRTADHWKVVRETILTIEEDAKKKRTG